MGRKYLVVTVVDDNGSAVPTRFIWANIPDDVRPYSWALNQVLAVSYDLSTNFTVTFEHTDEEIS